MMRWENPRGGRKLGRGRGQQQEFPAALASASRSIETELPGSSYRQQRCDFVGAEMAAASTWEPPGASAPRKHGPSLEVRFPEGPR